MKTDEQIGRECMEEVRQIATSTMLAELECRAALRDEARKLAAARGRAHMPMSTTAVASPA